jgi:hypothetical protein
MSFSRKLLRWRITGDRRDVASERSRTPANSLKFNRVGSIKRIEYELVPFLRKNAHHQPDGEERKFSSYTGVNGKKIKNFNVLM